MITFPIMLDLQGRSAAVVGGGRVGLRKVHCLLQAGARVRLIAERIDEGADLAGVDVRRQAYEQGLLDGATLVFACTANRQTNARIAADARRRGAWVNAADQPEDCDFFLPAVRRDGDVVLAVGTGGSAPALSARLRDRLGEALPEHLGAYAAALCELKDELRHREADIRRRSAVLRALADETGYEAFATGGVEALRRQMHRLLDAPEGTNDGTVGGNRTNR